jgi:hypothetical protein
MEDLPAIHANFAITSLKSIAEQQTLSTIYYNMYGT